MLADTFQLVTVDHCRTAVYFFNSEIGIYDEKIENRQNPCSHQIYL